MPSGLPGDPPLQPIPFPKRPTPGHKPGPGVPGREVAWGPQSPLTLGRTPCCRAGQQVLDPCGTWLPSGPIPGPLSHEASGEGSRLPSKTSRGDKQAAFTRTLRGWTESRKAQLKVNNTRKQQVLARTWRKRNTPALLVGTQAGNAATVQNSTEVPRKGKNRTTLRSSNRTNA